MQKEKMTEKLGNYMSTSLVLLIVSAPIIGLLQLKANHENTVLSSVFWISMSLIYVLGAGCMGKTVEIFRGVVPNKYNATVLVTSFYGLRRTEFQIRDITCFGAPIEKQVKPTLTLSVKSDRNERQIYIYCISCFRFTAMVHQLKELRKQYREIERAQYS